jgi:hypothetical protein
VVTIDELELGRLSSKTTLMHSVERPGLAQAVMERVPSDWPPDRRGALRAELQIAPATATLTSEQRELMNQLDWSVPTIITPGDMRLRRAVAREDKAARAVFFWLLSEIERT